MLFSFSSPPPKSRHGFPVRVGLMTVHIAYLYCHFHGASSGSPRPGKSASLVVASGDHLRGLSHCPQEVIAVDVWGTPGSCTVLAALGQQAGTPSIPTPGGSFCLAHPRPKSNYQEVFSSRLSSYFENTPSESFAPATTHSFTGN